MPIGNAINISETGLASFNSNNGVFNGVNLTTSPPLLPLTASSMTITNPDGVAGNPILDVNPLGININSLGGMPLSVANGGTGGVLPTAGGQLLTSGAGPSFTPTYAAPTPIQFFGSGLVVTNPLTPPVGLTAVPITLGDNVLLTVAGGGLPWVTISTATQTAVVNTGYTAAATTVNLTLPAAPVVGDKIYVTGDGTIAGLTWTVTLPATQKVYFGTQMASTNIVSTNATDSMYLVCIKASPVVWNVIASIGNMLVT